MEYRALQNQITATRNIRLREIALNVHLGADLIGFRLNYRAAPSHFGDMPIFEVTGSPFSGWNTVIKKRRRTMFSVRCGGALSAAHVTHRCCHQIRQQRPRAISPEADWTFVSRVLHLQVPSHAA